MTSEVPHLFRTRSERVPIRPSRVTAHRCMGLERFGVRKPPALLRYRPLFQRSLSLGPTVQDETLPLTFNETRTRIAESGLSIRSLSRLCGAVHGSPCPLSSRAALRPFFRVDYVGGHPGRKASATPQVATLKTLASVNRALLRFEEHDRDLGATLAAIAADRARIAAESARLAREAEYLEASAPRA